GEVAVYGLLAAPGFTLQAAPVSASVPAGGTVTYTLSVAPQNGFNQAVSFTCFGLPAGASCSFNPISVTTAGGPNYSYGGSAGGRRVQRQLHHFQRHGRGGARFRFGNTFSDRF
ncbi:MAG TPA: hypothetical protein VJP83_07035, partial [Terriglobales bacterium]|nr:hypothetical protein [Terriglobales bacterium]